MFTRKDLVFPMPKKNNRGYLKEVINQKSLFLEWLRKENDPITAATEAYVSMVKIGTLPACIEGMAQILQCIDGLDLPQAIQYIKTAPLFSVAPLAGSANTNETIFNYSDGTAKKMDITGTLRPSDHRSPFGKELTGVLLGRHITEIGVGAFRNCKLLTAITIPDSVTAIEKEAFDRCAALTSINIPHGIKSIKKWTFSECASLTLVTIPDNVTTIGTCAFFNCASLTSVNLPSNLTALESDAFCNCDSLTSIKVASDNLYYKDIDGVLFSKDGKTLIQYPTKKSSVYSIPNHVATIGKWAFQDSTNLISVTIPDSVRLIDEYAFRHCESLTLVVIPDGVTEIGAGAFHSCAALTSVTIPDSVTLIQEFAFAFCTALPSITIPDSIGKIWPHAFCNVPHIEYHGDALGTPWDAKAIN